MAEEENPQRKPRRRNMRAAEREQVILDVAVRFFAEHGFEGQTRELAKRMGITHSAIYRHFPSKDALIERVYEHVYLSRWDAAWGALIRDRALPLEARLTRFYLEYAARVFDHDWVRILVFASLRSYDIARRYLGILAAEIIEPACRELRHELGLPAGPEVVIPERERELFWGLHGRIFYLAIRRHVYGMPVPDPLDDVIRDAVRSFLHGTRAVLKELAGPAPAQGEESALGR